MPVGFIVHMGVNESPSEKYGGTWQKIASDRVLMGASETHTIGSTLEAGLPNIEGQFKARGVPNYDGTLVQGEDGAFHVYYIAQDRSGISLGSDAYTMVAKFNASKSNSIYGNSDTVQPATLFVNIWQRIA